RLLLAVVLLNAAGVLESCGNDAGSNDRSGGGGASGTAGNGQGAYAGMSSGGLAGGGGSSETGGAGGSVGEGGSGGSVADGGPDLEDVVIADRGEPNDALDASSNPKDAVSDAKAPGCPPACRRGLYLSLYTDRIGQVTFSGALDPYRN